MTARSKRIRKKPKLEGSEKYWIEAITSSSARAHELTQEAWRKSPELHPLVLSAALREIMIDIGHAAAMSKNLADALLGKTGARS